MHVKRNSYELISKNDETEIYDTGNDVLLKRKITKPTSTKNRVNEGLTNTEIEMLKKVNKLEINAPKFIKQGEYNEIYIQKIRKSENIEKLLENVDTEKEKFVNLPGCDKNIKIKKIFKKIGNLVYKLHHNCILHGSLRLSNFLINSKKKVYVIDFARAYKSNLISGMAIELYSFESTLLRHYSEKVVKWFYKGYLKYDDKRFRKELETNLNEFRNIEK